MVHVRPAADHGLGIHPLSTLTKISSIRARRQRKSREPTHNKQPAHNRIRLESSPAAALRSWNPTPQPRTVARAHLCTHSPPGGEQTPADGVPPRRSVCPALRPSVTS